MKERLCNNNFRGTSFIILETTDGMLSSTTGFLQDTAIIVYSMSGKTFAFGKDPDLGRKVNEIKLFMELSDISL